VDAFRLFSWEFSGLTVTDRRDEIWCCNGSITRIFPTFNATGCRFPIVYEGLLSLYRWVESRVWGEGGGRRRRGRMRRIKGSKMEEEVFDGLGRCRVWESWKPVLVRKRMAAGGESNMLAVLSGCGLAVCYGGLSFLGLWGGIWRSGVLSGWDCSLGCLDFWLGVVVIPLAAKGLLALGWISLESAQRRAPKP
jgi:hypothetical protein